jgi:hypothetical protein
VHVPDPIEARADATAPDPEQEALLADSVGLALLVVLDTLATASPQATFRPAVVNGVAGMLVLVAGRPAALSAFTVSGGRIAAIDGIADPARLAALRLDPALLG